MNIVKEHDGELKFESDQEKGTTATLILPKANK
jgi:signal transduction histidine kinase